MRLRNASSSCAPRLAVICTDGSFWYTLGNAYSALTASTSRIRKYFQRGNSSIATVPRGTIPAPRLAVRTTSSDRYNVANGLQMDTGGTAEPVGHNLRFHLTTAPA